MTWDIFRFYFLLSALLYAVVATALNLFLTIITAVARADGWKGFLCRTAGYLIVSIVMFFLVLKYR